MMGSNIRRSRMESTPRWGITLPLRSLPLPDQRDLVAALPDLGYTDAWSSEVNGSDAFAPPKDDVHRAVFAEIPRPAS